MLVAKVYSNVINLNYEKRIIYCFDNCFTVAYFIDPQNLNPDCNKTVNFKKFSSLLPKDFCMPIGFWVVDVFIEDINGDDLKDKMIEYYKKDWKCEDTVFLAVYFARNDSTYRYMKTFTNLFTPMVRDFVSMEWIVKNCSNEYIYQYSWDNQMWLAI